MAVGIMAMLATIACAPGEAEIRSIVREELGASLVPGPQGIQGERGERGPQGIQGVQGERGIRGQSGVQGERGERGPQGERGPAGLAHSYTVAYSEGMEHMPAVPDFVIPLPDKFRVEGIEDSYFFEWTVPERGDPHYSGSLPSDSQVWQLYPPNANNASRTEGFCSTTDWTSLFLTEADSNYWYFCDDSERGGREGSAKAIAARLDEAKGLSSRLHIYQAYDWEQ